MSNGLVDTIGGVATFANGRSNLFNICGVGGMGRAMVGGLSGNFAATNGEFLALPGFCGSGGGCLIGEPSMPSIGFFRL